MIDWLVLIILLSLLIILLPVVYAGYVLAVPVPSSQEAVEIMLKIAGTDQGDTVYDLGSGDGRIIITAAKKFGAKACGFEISPVHFLITKFLIKKNNLDSKVKVLYKNFYKADLKNASIITIFGHPTTMKRLGEKVIIKLKPGTRIVSYAFPIINLKPQKIMKGEKYAPIYLYVKH